MEEKLFLTKEQSQHLQALGLDMSDSKAWLCINNTRDSNGRKTEDKGHIVFAKRYPQKVGFMRFEYYPTYTLQEILKKLPEISYKGSLFTWKINSCEERMVYSCGPYTMYACSYHESTILECAYSMLCWTLENGYSI